MLNAAAAVRRGDGEIIENLLSEQVLDAAIEVHRTLGGPGTTRKSITSHRWAEKGSQ